MSDGQPPVFVTVDADERDADAGPSADDDTVRTPPAVTAHETRPGRTVFTEAENPDGWIAVESDVTIESVR